MYGVNYSSLLPTIIIEGPRKTQNSIFLPMHLGVCSSHAAVCQCILCYSHETMHNSSTTYTKMKSSSWAKMIRHACACMKFLHAVACTAASILCRSPNLHFPIGVFACIWQEMRENVGTCMLMKMAGSMLQSTLAITRQECMLIAPTQLRALSPSCL